MISSVRKHLNAKSILFKAVLWAMAFSFLGGGGLIYYFSNSSKPGSIATVNGVGVSMLEISGFIHQVRQIMNMSPDLAAQLLPNVKNEVDLIKFAVESRIPSKVMASKASEIGINISDDYASEQLHNKNSSLKNIVESIIGNKVYKDGVLDSDLLIKTLKKYNLSIENFESMLKENFAINIFQDIISNGIYIPNYILQEKYIRDFSKKKFNIVSVDLEDYIKKVQSEKISDQEIEEYFNNNKESYRIPENRSVFIWSFDPINYDIQVDDHELRDYYDKDKKKDKKSFEESKSDIEKIVKQNKFKEKFNIDAKMALDSDNLSVFEEFVKNKHAIKSELDNIVKNNKDNRALSNKVFQILNIGDKSFYQNENKGYIIELKAIVESYIPEMTDVQADIAEDIYKVKAQQLLDADLTNAVKSSKSINEIEKEFKNSKLEQTDWIDFSKNDDLFKSIPKDVLNKFWEVKQREEYSKDAKGYVIELAQLDVFNQEDFNERKEELRQYLMYEQSRNILDDLIYDWRSKAQIKYSFKS